MAISRQQLSPETSRASRAVTDIATIFVVEDEASVRNVVVRFLTLSGFRVLSAADVRGALAIWTESGAQVDLLLTDIIMPGAMSGRTLAKRFLADQPTLKVLYTSGYSAESLNADGTLDEEIFFLQKPYRPEQLLESVRDVLAGRFPTDQNQNQNCYAEITSR